MAINNLTDLFYSGLSSFNPSAGALARILPQHTGNMGLPDWGATEVVQRLLYPNQPFTSEGGSNLFGQGGAIQTPTATSSTNTSPYQDILNTGANTTSGGGSSSYSSSNNVPSLQDQLRGQIETGWNDFLGSLDQILGGLGGQRSAQESIAQSQANQSRGALGLQKQQGEQGLETQRGRVQQNQATNLRDLAENIRNSFLSGNIYLGSRGAGDSSAGDQYSYALTKLGTKQRSGLMQNTANLLGDIDNRWTNLQNTYNTEMNKVSDNLNIAMQNVAQWFSNAQNQILQQKAQGGLGKSQDLANLSRDILNRAVAAVNNAQQQAASSQAYIQNWANTQGQTLNQSLAQLGGISDTSGQVLPQRTPLTGQMQESASGNSYLPTGGGTVPTEETKKQNIFSGLGNIWSSLFGY